jgi:hypothetical protein
MPLKMMTLAILISLEGISPSGSIFFISLYLFVGDALKIGIDGVVFSLLKHRGVQNSLVFCH